MLNSSVNIHLPTLRKVNRPGLPSHNSLALASAKAYTCNPNQSSQRDLGTQIQAPASRHASKASAQGWQEDSEAAGGQPARKDVNDAQGWGPDVGRRAPCRHWRAVPDLHANAHTTCTGKMEKPPKKGKELETYLENKVCGLARMTEGACQHACTALR